MPRKEYSVTEARAAFSDVVASVHYTGERILLMKQGKPMAGIVSTEDLELLRAIENLFDIDAARAALKETGNNLSLDELKTALGL